MSKVSISMRPDRILSDAIKNKRKIYLGSCVIHFSYILNIIVYWSKNKQTGIETEITASEAINLIRNDMIKIGDYKNG